MVKNLRKSANSDELLAAVAAVGKGCSQIEREGGGDVNRRQNCPAII